MGIFICNQGNIDMFNFNSFNSSTKFFITQVNKKINTN